MCHGDAPSLADDQWAARWFRFAKFRMGMRGAVPLHKAERCQFCRMPNTKYHHIVAEWVGPRQIRAAFLQPRRRPEWRPERAIASA